MGTGGRRTTRRARATAAVLGALAAGFATAGAAQERCADDERVGSFGLTGISCERCQFVTEGGVSRAVFWTEPVVEGLDPSAPAARVLRVGDVLVAVDGQLITTASGQARFSAPPAGETVPVRVRRDGRTLELSVPVGSVCPRAASPSVPAVAGRPVRPTPPAPPAPAAVVAPAAPPAPTPPSPVVPPSPSLPPMAPTPPPRATLGFGFRCSTCTSRATDDTVTWSFSAPPEVTGVQRGGPADVAGLRPGDRILAVDGVDITTEAGGRRFAAIRPGDRVRWTVDRDGTTVDVTSAALDRPAVAGPQAPVADVLRFSGRVGDALVEVRGGRVTVVEDDDGRYLIIRTADTEIRIRAGGN